jgi:hypothetical protein
MMPPGFSAEPALGRRWLITSHRLNVSRIDEERRIVSKAAVSGNGCHAAALLLAVPWSAPIEARVASIASHELERRCATRASDCTASPMLRCESPATSA